MYALARRRAHAHSYVSRPIVYVCVFVSMRACVYVCVYACTRMYMNVYYKYNKQNRK